MKQSMLEIFLTIKVSEKIGNENERKEIFDQSLNTFLEKRSKKLTFGKSNNFQLAEPLDLEDNSNHEETNFNKHANS